MDSGTVPATKVLKKSLILFVLQKKLVNLVLMSVLLLAIHERAGFQLFFVYLTSAIVLSD